MKVMFICTGNICRSPLAHAIFEHMIQQRELSDSISVESSGTGAWHLGEQADSRMRQTAHNHGISLNHRSRRLNRQDPGEYDLLLTMDQHNFRDTRSLCRHDSEKKKVRMFRDFDPEGEGDVPDPWYGDLDGFEEVWRIVHRTCEALLDTLESH